jgi:transcriptional regulator with XRE-family HTH domain
MKRLREGLRLSQEVVFRRGKLSSQGRVSELERGTDVQISTLVGAMRGLNVTPAAFLREWEDLIRQRAAKSQNRFDEARDYPIDDAGKSLGDDGVTGLESLLPIAGPNAQNPGGVAMNEWEKVTWRRYASALGRLGHLDHAAQERFVADVDQKATEVLSAPARHRRLGK